MKRSSEIVEVLREGKGSKRGSSPFAGGGWKRDA